MEYSLVGNRIRQIRELKNIKQSYLAIQLEISTRAYSKIESGESHLTVSRLYRIAQVLNVDVADVVSARPINTEFISGSRYQESIVHQLNTISQELSWIRKRLECDQDSEAEGST
ncbi:helix-turn-helix domain-containing protein [Phaeocystidibacter luteus]|uniref:Helix-turn-helix transcriptional regulator n=1 Tax=Phaeocystidibacter luteus TaxID=911197 RepID=A0A6N6RL57_9FLAO|nr:helix-turn-helix transcriptional regulator [Phaeocystidibacter luteus]KAB2813692.1 helix-turn-helix transcriptional regulator [Phaeocystidibacter luteus]